MAENIPGLLGLSGDNPTHCPLCNAPVNGSDGLQLHYLTSCKSYDKMSNEQPRSKPRNDPHPEPTSGHHGNTAHASNGGFTGGGVVSRGSSQVQFMWQPLTEITYPTIMLLASFESGSVPLELDPDGGHYASAKVSIPNGTYEGQLVIGDSFVYPVRKFTVGKRDDIIILQFDVEQGKTFTDMEVPSTSHYGTGHMTMNPSFSGVSEVGRPTHSSGISTDLLGGSSGFGYYSDAYQNHKNRGQSSVQPQVTRHTAVSNKSTTAQSGSAKNIPTHAATTTLPDNATVTSHSATPVPDNSAARPLPHSDNSTTRARPAPTITSGGASARPHSSTTTPASTKATAQTTPTTVSSRIANVPLVSENDRRHTVPEGIGQSSSGFNVGELRQTERQLSADVIELRRQLEAVEKERNELRQNQQRVNARWDGRVKRLETELATLRSGGVSPQDNSRLAQALHEAQGQITRLEEELSTLRREREERATNTQSSSELQRQLREMKDRNTALEQQLVEYVGTISDQSKYIQSSVARDKQQSTDAIASQQDFIHMTAFAKKQQLENAEALADLQKKITATSVSIDDTRGLHQTNVRLAAEIEDYREQTKLLLQDIVQKDEEIGKLKESLYKGHPQGSDELELATLREKVTAYQEEYEKMASFRDEVEQLHELTAQQQEEIHRLKTDNNELSRELQALVDNSDQQDPELIQRVKDYDTLLDRYHELQETRIQLENELQPLRQERATMLRENAHLREASDPQGYVRLKRDYDALLKHCQQLEATVAAHEDTNREMRTKLDQTTNPEMLQGIRERMDRYKNERDMARRRVEELENQLTSTENDRQATYDKLQEASEQSQKILSDYQSDLSKLERYRNERNYYKKKCKEQEKQLINWKDLVVKSEHLRSTTDPNGGEYDPAYDSPRPPSDLPGSPSSDYHPLAYSDNTLQQYHRESVDSPVNELEVGMASLSVEPSKVHRKQHTAGSRVKNITGSTSFEMVDVKTKDGTKVVNVGRPHGELSAKTKPKVVVKRGEEYEQGTLMYVGTISGKEMAGILMDSRLSKPSGTATNTVGNDGTHSDGRRYFKCPVGYGLYVPVSKVFLEVESYEV